MGKTHRVTLTPAERDEPGGVLGRGKADVRRLKHAQVLRKADQAEGGPGWTGVRIAEAVGVGRATVERVRRRFVEEGLASALRPCRTGARVYGRKLDGVGEAHLIALACSAPSEAQARRTLRLLASRMVELAHVDALSCGTVRRTLKKERPQAAPAQDVAHPRQTPGRVCLPHGGRAGRASSPARSRAAGCVRG